MNKIKQGMIAVASITALTGLQLGLAPVSSANSTLSYRAAQEVPTLEAETAAVRSTTLSWIEAQQRRYDNNPGDNAGELNAEQQNKLVTMIRLMTLEL